MFNKKTKRVIVSPVICVIGDFDKVGEFVLGNLKVASAYKGMVFLEELGVSVVVREINALPEVDPEIRRYNIFKADDGIVWHRNVGFLGQAFLVYKDLNENMPFLAWNWLFRLWSSLPVTKVGFIGHHLESIITLKLIERGMVLLHGSAVSVKSSSVLFTGLPNQGKTCTAMELIRNGYEFVSEDICVLSRSGEVFSVPFTTSLKSDINKSQKATLLDVFPDLRISQVSRLSKVVILERARENTVVHLSPTEAVRRILLINHLEFHYHSNGFLKTYLALHQLPPIHHFMTLEEEIIREVVSMRPVYLVRFSHHSSISRLIEQVLGGG